MVVQTAGVHCIRYTVDGTQRTVYGTRMEYLTKTMRLDAEVIAWLDKLKSMWGSYNKGLRLIAFTDDRRGKPPMEAEVVKVNDVPHTEDRKPSTVLPRPGKMPLLKPSQR